VENRQVARHSSPAFDLTYFLYTSARSEVLEHDIDELIDTYERFFIHDLRRLDAPEHDLKSLVRPGWFKDELRRYGLFGFFGALMVLHAVFTEEDRAVNIGTPRSLLLSLSHPTTAPPIPTPALHCRSLRLWHTARTAPNIQWDP
jgi:hypothetical protein